LQEGKRELGLTPENIQAVVETALELAKQPSLRKRMLHDPLQKSPIRIKLRIVEGRTRGGVTKKAPSVIIEKNKSCDGKICFV
jgi:hypothetical protein